MRRRPWYAAYLHARGPRRIQIWAHGGQPHSCTHQKTTRLEPPGPVLCYSGSSRLTCGWLTPAPSASADSKRWTWVSRGASAPVHAPSGNSHACNRQAAYADARRHSARPRGEARRTRRTPPRWRRARAGGSGRAGSLSGTRAATPARRPRAWHPDPALHQTRGMAAAPAVWRWRGARGTRLPGVQLHAQVVLPQLGQREGQAAACLQRGGLSVCCPDPAP